MYFAIQKELSLIAEPKQGMVTRDNKRFIRMREEIDFKNIEFNSSSHEDSSKNNKKWYPITDGGSFRKWYGNTHNVVNFYNDGKGIIGYSGSHIKNREFYFLENITWSAISSDEIAMRYTNKEFLPEHAGNCLFAHHDTIIYLLGTCNSKVTGNKAISPTLNFNVGQIANIPVMENINNERKSNIKNLVNNNINISKNDWDSFEESWGFKKHPLV